MLRKGFSTVFFVLLVLSVVLSAGIAMAANAAPQTPAQDLATTLQQTVFPVLGSLLLGFISWACTKLGQKFHIDSLTQKNNILIQIAAQGVAYAEEKAASLVGSKAELTGSEKLDEAIAYICRALPKVSADDAQRAATAVLAMIPGIGASGSTAVSLTASAVVPAPVPDQFVTNLQPGVVVSAPLPEQFVSSAQLGGIPATQAM